MIRQSKVTIREIGDPFVDRWDMQGTVDILKSIHTAWRYSHTLGKYHYYVMNVSD